MKSWLFLEIGPNRMNTDFCENLRDLREIFFSPVDPADFRRGSLDFVSS